jgi:hypothetical protein
MAESSPCRGSGKVIHLLPASSVRSRPAGRLFVATERAQAFCVPMASIHLGCKGPRYVFRQVTPPSEVRSIGDIPGLISHPTLDVENCIIGPGTGDGWSVIGAALVLR